MFLWLILAAAAALRLWRLDTPSLWFDEVLVAMVAKLPCASIVARSLAEDFHPPTFYLLAKAAMGIGISDAALRLPLTAFGLAGVWLSWRVGREMLDERFGLAMAAVCAALPWHVLLSRQLRPYAVIFFFSLLSLYFLMRVLRGGGARDAALAGLSLWPPLLLHYSALLAAGGGGCVLLAGWAAGRCGWRHVLAFGGLVLAPATVVSPFLASSLGHEQGASGGADRAALAVECLQKLGELLFREPLPWARGILAVLALAGLARLWRADRPLALASLGWLACPLAVLVAAGYGSYFNPWHLAFLMPVAVLWLGSALAAVLPGPAAAALCAGAAALFFTAGDRYYYQPGSYSGEYKQQASQLLAGHSPGTVYVYPQSGVTGPLNWYLDAFSEANPLREQRITPDMARVRAVTPDDRGTSETVIERDPVIPMDGLPFRTRITPTPVSFLAQVNRLEYLACQPVLEDIIVATQAGRTGFAEFLFENREAREHRPQRITVHFGFSNRLPGNRFAVLCRFDDEPWAASFESLGPDPRRHDKIELSRERPYRLLTVRFELLRDGSSVTFTGEDLEAVRLLDFKVEADPEKN